MTNDEVLNKIKDLCKNIGFENYTNELNYKIHKFFDFIIHDSQHKKIFKIERTSNIIPIFINVDEYFKENKKIWSQEYKVHFDIELSKNNDYYFLSFSIDRNTKPKKVFVKEYRTTDVLAELSNENKLQRIQEND